MKKIVILILILAICITQEEQLSFISNEDALEKTTEQIITNFAQKQGEIIRKVFTHYIE